LPIHRKSEQNGFLLKISNLVLLGVTERLKNKNKNMRLWHWQGTAMEMRNISGVFWFGQGRVSGIKPTLHHKMLQEIGKIYSVAIFRYCLAINTGL
jgi:hypothetical protein